ncbi:unnamed protein product [Rotaria socialis]|uniref:Uncharacterized protein n=1 Tax=Rotaria socialis TaxID=392032 RepID=A0A818UM19_9BILA|nr:unnamed protein product [Rotaria socialis]CAF3700287.1 unnamed protein product [Rotaria socialis]CAF4513999.1 unnamed protein product [Rotaria socialis]CAF4564945.1 unnamed protein product [Rotaria socialis]
MQQIISASDSPFFQWTNQVPISFTDWKCILSTITTKETSKLSSSDQLCRSTTQITKSDRQSLPRNQVFGDKTVESFIASSSNLAQSSISISRQDVPKILSPPTKRYVSSFKTIVSSTNSKPTQRLNSVNNNVMILKVPKEHTHNSANTGSPFSSKHSTLSMATTTATIMSTKSQQQTLSPSRLSPILKVEGQKRRIVHHESSVATPSSIDSLVGSNPTNQMATSASGHPQTNSTVFTYRSAAAGGNTIRQRAIAETTTNSMLITTERLKLNMSSAVRSTRQLLPAPTTIASTYVSSQQTQRNHNQNSKSRTQQDKSIHSRDNFDYPDPFTNCPQEILSKLAQLTKLQMETIEWERKKRFTKKKPITNGAFQGKDSP